MSLPKEEIKYNLKVFAERWKNETKENAGSQTFWNEFFLAFGHDRKKIASFEKPVEKFDGRKGRVDVFWEGVLLAEHKSGSTSNSTIHLEKALQQGKDYLPKLKNYQLPKHLIVSDFRQFIYEKLGTNEQIHFTIDELPKKIGLFEFFTGFSKVVELQEVDLNRKAADILTKLYNELLKDNHDEDDLKILIIRIMFCLFAEDTDIFKKNLFYNLIINHTKEDGSDLGTVLNELFETLNTESNNRSKHLESHFKVFDFVNGQLFKKRIATAHFNSKMRQRLLDCCKFEWEQISPVIFGSMFQNISKDRDKNGVHYTSELNIRKVIDSLFLDDLYKELSDIKNLRSVKELRNFQTKISKLTFLDPASGCGNFLITIYKEIRLLEIEVLRAINKLEPIQLSFDVRDVSKIKIENFYGIELLEFPPMVAELGMWLIDHLMNIKLGESFGKTYKRIPLDNPVTIHRANALRVDWENVIRAKDLDYIVGNPPFIGSKKRDNKNIQKQDLITAMENQKKVAECDYVAGWFWKSLRVWENNKKIKIGLVSTNSITMGQQIELLWKKVFETFTDIEIFFAHKTFSWANDAKNKASVYCNIIGLKKKNNSSKSLFHYSDVKGNSELILSKEINPYLMDYKFIPVTSRSKPLFNLPKMNSGNMPLKGQPLIFESKKEVSSFLKKEPKAKKYIKPLISSHQFLHGKSRYCLWLVGIKPSELNSLKYVKERVKLVKEARLKTPDQAAVDRPHEFRDTNNPDLFIVIPRHSSENRKYIPIGFYDKNVIPSDSCSFVWSGSKYIFGLLTSYIHMVWMKEVGGKLESRYRYSKEIIYNNYPIPVNPNEKQIGIIEGLVQQIIDIRKSYPESTLADLYGELSPAKELIKTHKKLDRIVEKLYRKEPFKDDKERIEFLFDLYEKKSKLEN